MRRALAALAISGAIAVAGTIALADPERPAVMFVAAGVGAVVGGTTALILTAGARPRRSRQNAGMLLRGARRGLALGVVAGLLTYLRAIDAVSPLTVFFVALPFVAAEVVLSARVRSG